MGDAKTAPKPVRTDTKPPTASPDPVPAVVDWVLGAITAVVGFALTAVGAGMYTRVDRTIITEFITAESTEVNGLTPAEAVTAGVPFVDWFSVGVALTGLGLVAAAAVFVRGRRRTRRRVASEGGTTATFWASAVYGAAVTALVSFVHGSGIVGGALAAYLHEGESGLRVGATTGLVGWALTVPLLVFLAVGLLAGAGAVDRFTGGVVLVGITLVGELAALALNVGFGALGGYLPDRFV
jgi:ascorbate-specific PTS system EIIC-type component UlaA